MESLFLLAFGEEEFLAALAMTGLEAFFNKLLELENGFSKTCVEIDSTDLDGPGFLTPKLLCYGKRGQPHHSSVGNPQRSLRERLRRRLPVVGVDSVACFDQRECGGVDEVILAVTF